MLPGGASIAGHASAYREADHNDCLVCRAVYNDGKATLRSCLYDTLRPHQAGLKVDALVNEVQGTSGLQEEVNTSKVGPSASSASIACTVGSCTCSMMSNALKRRPPNRHKIPSICRVLDDRG